MSTERRRQAGHGHRRAGSARPPAAGPDWARPNGGARHHASSQVGGRAGEDSLTPDHAGSDGRRYGDAGRGGRSGGSAGGGSGRGPAGGSGGQGGRGGRRYAAAEKKKGFFRKLFSIKGFLLTGLLMFVLGAAGIAVAYAMTPIPDANDFSTSESTIVYWNDGETELGRFSVEDRETVTLDKIPEHVRQAVIAAEDRSFYENPGFDIVGIARAAYGTATSGEITGGGSTITQQYVKNYHLTQDQTITRKLKELFISVKLDQRLSKDQILQDYLNTIWFGRGTYGVQTASRSYFDKPISELELNEGVALAAVIRNPDLYDPTIREENEERFADRFQFVINGMVETGALDQATASELEPPEIEPADKRNTFGGTNGYLLQQVQQELRDLGFEDVEIQTGGLRVVTTFDRKAQKAAVKAVKEEFPTDEDGDRIEDLHAGLAAVEPGDGAVLAMYGGPDAVEQSRNDAIQARLQPGSTAKPFGLVAALENGISLESRYHGNSPIEDERLGERGFVNNQNDWSYGGPIDLLSATERSTNTAFIDLTLQEGYEDMQDAMFRAGIPEDAPGMDIAEYRSLIGIFNASPMEMAEAYATLAAGGEHTDWYTVDKVTAPGGMVKHEADPNPERVFDADAVADTTYALTQVVESENGTAKAARELGRPAAGKTGTHEEITSWFAGYTPQLAATVMFYEGDGSTNSSLRGIVSGGTRDEPFPGGGVPAQTWTAFMKGALDGEGVIPFPEPANVGEAVNPAPTAEPTCEPGFEGTPPDCTEIEEEEEPDRECPEGTEGTPPNCLPIEEEEPDDVPMPDVMGQTELRAKHILGQRGFDDVIVDYQTVEDGGQVGLVVGQDPAPEVPVAPGSQVTITVAAAPDDDGEPDPCDERPRPPGDECDDDGGGGGGGGNDNGTDTNAYGQVYGRLEVT